MISLSSRISLMESRLAALEARATPRTDKPWDRTMEAIASDVAVSNGCSVAEMRGHRKPQHVADARAIFCLICYKDWKIPMKIIAKWIRRGESGVDYAIRKGKNLCEMYPVINQQVLATVERQMAMWGKQ
jgi:chromosomal replication initiation ATPase DnaA